MHDGAMTVDQVPLSPHVTRWMGPRGGGYPYGNPLTVTGGETTVLLDSALGLTAPPSDVLLLSHYHEDHTVDAAARATDVMIHRRDAAPLRSWDAFLAVYGLPEGDWEAELKESFSWAALPDVDTFGDDAVVDVGGGVRIHVVPLPGHTPGHCGFMVEPDRVFYIADVDLSSFGPMYGDRDSSLSQVRETLRKVADIDAAVVVPYHSKGPYTERADFLDALQRHANVLQVREDKLLALLDAGPQTIADMTGKGVVYRPETAPTFADAVETVTFAEHLDELVARGIVVGPDADGRFALNSER